MPNLFQFPKFPDSELTQKSRILFKLVWGWVFLVTCFSIINIIILPDYLYLWLSIVLVVDFIAVISLVLNHKGKFRSASIVFITLCLVHVSFLALPVGGAKAAVFQALPIFVLVAGLLLGWKEGFVVGCCVIFSGMLMVILEFFNMLPGAYINQSSLSIWIFTSLNVGLITWLQYLSVSNFNFAYKKSQQELKRRQKAEIVLKRIIENSHELICEIDSRGRFIYNTPNFYDVLGLKPDELFNTQVEALIHPDDREDMLTKLFALSENDSISLILRMKHKNGESYWFESMVKVYLIENQEKVYFVYSRNITESMRAEQSLREKTTLLEAQVNSSSDGILVIDENNKRLLINHRFVELFSVPQYILQDDDDSALLQYIVSLTQHPKEFLEKVIDLNNHPQQTSFDEVEFKNKMVVQRYTAPVLDVENNYYGRIWTFRDITNYKLAQLELVKYRDHLEFLVKLRTEELNSINEELKATNDELNFQKDELEATIQSLNMAQDQLIHSEKMASLGVLSAGIAHEINNPLNFIKGGILAIEKYLKNNATDHLLNIQKLVDAVHIGVKRAAEIVTSLSHYSRSDNVFKTNCNIHEIIDNCLVMLHSQLKNKVEVLTLYSPYPCFVLGNEGKLHQVMLNILSNAQQAIEKKGIIQISTEVTDNEVVIVVADSGCGISSENLPKIFDPFFTTKEIGKGTGLGLSITYNIVNEHNGAIKFESIEGVGTKAIIRFPLVKF